VSTKKKLGTVGWVMILGVIAAMAPVAGQALSMTVSNLAGLWRSVRARISFGRNNAASR
jgi:hypothetical protein